MRKKFEIKYIFLLIILISTFTFFYSPTHRYNIDVAKSWWQGWFLSAQTNLYPNERGLNVAIFSSEGEFIESKYFDTYYYSDSGFPAFINSLPYDSWVVIAAMGEAATNLSLKDIKALKYLGGTDSLVEKYNWAYILVGRKGLGEGKGNEWLNESYLHIRLEEGTIVGDMFLPVTMNIYSLGFYSDIESFACINTGEISFLKLEYWFKAVIKRI